MQTRENQPSRRDFLRDTGLAATVALGGAHSWRKAHGATPLGANDRIGIAMVGCGGRGMHHAQHLMGLRELGAQIEIVAACDAYRPRMAALAERTGAAQYWDYAELLEDPAVDLVCISTPDHVHGQQVMDAVRAKKDIFCEKPFTHWSQFDHTREVTEAVVQSRQMFQLGTQGMSDSAWQQMKQMVAAGKIGQPIHAECGYFRVGDWGERGMPVDDPDAQPGHDLNWEAFLGSAPERPFDVSRFFRWRMYEDYSGGPSTDLFPHSLTPVVDMLGLTMPLLAVGTGGKFRYAEREVPDTFNTLIDYPEGVTIAVLGTQGNRYGGTGHRGAGQRIPILRGWEGTLTVEGDDILCIAEEQTLREAERTPIKHGEHMGRHWENLLESCRTREQPASPVDLALHVQAALQMGMLSLRKGTVIRHEEGMLHG